MPPRISRSSVPNSRPRGNTGPTARKPKKAAKRALDAFSIAAHDIPNRLSIGKGKSRLGEDAEYSAHRKRARNEDEDEDEEEDEEPKRRRRDRDDNVDEGSDSEGNTWQMGHVDIDEDDDSDIDSDEAFGEGDEEVFEGWTFRGSSTTQNPRKKKTKARKLQEEEEEEDMGGDIDLDEGESADGEEEEDEDDLGEDAIDLATALDQYEESEEEERPKKHKKSVSAFDDSEPSENEDIGADGASDFNTSDEDEESESEKIDRLKNLISSLPEEQEGKSKRIVEAHEGGAPSEFGVMRKIDLASFKPRITDPERKKSLKLLQDDLKPSNRNNIARKLDAPLPKRQQDKLDRQAANEKANETLGRWVDTVKQNRRAEHLSFPLMHPNAGESYGESQLLPTQTSAPANALEATIQSILQESGLSKGNDDEAQFQKWEELQTNKLPLEEVAKRRAQLRKERELMFREEVRAKRIKKIKSKAYRRVHRKERERILQREKDALRADGVELSEDEREYNDRRRAEERMGAKHRESRWAKGIKESGRAAWDDDARAGVTEMARRNEELRRRIEGKEVREEDEDGSDFSTNEDDDVDEDEDGDQVLQKQLGVLKQNPFSTENSKLGAMKFMQKAESARRARNDEDIERMRRELAGEETHSEDEDENAARTGRKKFGPGAMPIVPAIQPKYSEFEERPGSDNEADGKTPTATNGISNGASQVMSKTHKAWKSSSPRDTSSTQNPYLMKAPKEKKSNTESDALLETQDIISAIQEKPKSKTKKSKSKDTSDEIHVSAPDEDGFMTVTYGNKLEDEDEDDIENEGIDIDFGKSQALVAKAFAGDDQHIQEEFEADKKRVQDEEAEKVYCSHQKNLSSSANNAK